MGVSVKALRRVLREFKGVEHRIEFTRILDGVTYYNDSKGTNPESTIKAIEAMTKPTVLLLGAGNYDKQSDYRPVFRAAIGKVKAAVVNGSNTEAIMKAAVDEGFTEIVAVGDDFREMILTARGLASEGDAVLLSPACASWGMFTDYEERGRIFKDIVNSL
jgi:UDP-N-acetylmuramoylalanine--D-glutamate ligase